MSSALDHICTRAREEPRESCSCDAQPQLIPHDQNPETARIQGVEGTVTAEPANSHSHLLFQSNNPAATELPQGLAALQIHSTHENIEDSPEVNVPLPPVLSLHPSFNDDMIFHDHRPELLDIVLNNDPVVFHGVGQNYEPALLSGDLILSLPEPTNIREIALCFYGKARIPSVDNRQPHVRQHQTTHTLISHDWSFLEGAKTHKHTLKAGRHVFPFSLQLDGTLPATTITPYASVTYKLRATVIRSAFTPNWVTQKPVQIVRSFSPEALEYNQTLEIENTWPGKIMYSIMLPHKAYAAGDQIPVLLKFSPMAKGVSVLSIETSIKEYTTVKWKSNSSFQDQRTVTTCRHIIRNGQAFNASAVYDLHEESSQPSSSRNRGSGEFSREGNSGSSISRMAALGSAVLLAPGLAREDWTGENSSYRSANSAEAPMGDQDIDTSIKIPIPKATTPTHVNDPIIVLQKIKWSIILSNLDGHTSELRCALPIHILSHSVLEEARLATHETRALLFGAEEPSEAQPSTLPSYASHVHDRIANAIDGIDGVATLGPNPLHNLDHNSAHSSHSGTPSSSPSGPSGYFPSNPHWPPSTLSSAEEDARALARVDSGLLLSLGDSVHQALRGTAGLYRSSPTDSHGHGSSARQSRTNSRVNSRASSRAPSPERGAYSTDSHFSSPNTLMTTPGSHSSSSGHSSFFGSATSRFHISLKPFTRSAKSGNKVSSTSSPVPTQAALPHPMSMHMISPPPSRPPTRPPSRQNLRAEFNGNTTDLADPQSLDSQLMVELLSRVPDYRRASRGFLGGGVTPLESSIGLPTYDELDRMHRVQSEGSIIEFGRHHNQHHRRSGDHSMMNFGLSSTRPPTPVSEESADNDEEGITMRTATGSTIRPSVISASS